jgi:2-dehydro-3-deoxygalactonokinase
MSERMRWPNGLIAVDWGTTNRRAYLLNDSGECTDEIEDEKGALSIPRGGFPDAVAEVRERLGDRPMLLAGMVGSNRGWVEAPYVPCPAGVDEIARAMVWPSDREGIVPGVSYVGDDRADVMRGEEVQLVGAIAAGLIPEGCEVCHPGTHNKWAVVASGKIESFRTVMTGELFSLLREHSVLSDLLQGDAAPDDAFRVGVEHALNNDDIPAELFAIRARVLLGKSAADEAVSYASGLLIGADVRIGIGRRPMGDVFVMGRPELTELYAAALGEAGASPTTVDGEQSFLAGIRAIAERI